MEKKTNETKSAKIKEKFVELSSSSTSHGYPNMFRTKYWSVRVMWLIFFLAATGFCAFMIYRSLNDYLSFDVVTEIRGFSEIPTDYPTITLCNLNPMISKASYKLITKYLKKNITLDLSLNAKNLTNSVTDTISKSYEDLLSAKVRSLNDAMNPTYGDANKKLLGVPLGQFMLYCKYNGKLCNESDFSWIYSYEYGNCYQFNSGKDSNMLDAEIKKSYVTGNRNGLYLELYPYEAESVYSLQSDVGLIVFVHNKTSRPVPSEGIKLLSGVLTNIVVEKSYAQKSPYPFSDCVDLDTFEFDRTYYNTILSANLGYKQKDCFDLCLQDITIAACGCYDLKYAAMRQAAPCLDETQVKCVETQYFNFIGSDINGKCANYCPLECVSESFAYKFSMADFPSQTYAGILKKSPVFENLADDFGESSVLDFLLAVNIYYSDLGYTLVTESPKTSIFDIVANVGGIYFIYINKYRLIFIIILLKQGTLGLFIGISLLSVVEVIEMLMECLIILMYYKPSNKVESISQTSL